MALQICRICGSERNLLDIFEQGGDMLEKLSKCANIEVKLDDILPKHICEKCNQTLELSYQLRKQSEALQQRLMREVEARVVPKAEAEVEAEAKTASDTQQDNSLEANELLLDEKTDSLHYMASASEVSSRPTDTFDESSESTVLASEVAHLSDLEDFKFEVTKLENPSYVADSSDILTVRVGTATEPTVNFSHATVQHSSNTFLHSQASTDDKLCHIDTTCLQPVAKHEDSSDVRQDTQLTSSSHTFTCITCNEKFCKRKDYVDHILQHGDNRYQCIQCLQSFPTRYRLKRHEAVHLISECHTCSFCNHKFTALSNLERHIKSCHSSDREFQCNICQAKFSRRDVLNRHVTHIHSNKKWRCKVCEESFRSAYLLKMHHLKKGCGSYEQKKPGRQNSVLPPLPPEYIVLASNNRYKCIHCNSLFKTLNTYRNHLLIHENIKPFPCPSCPKSFRTRYALINHERIHNNEKPFKCDLCPKSFRQITHLKNHRYLHTKCDMPYKCNKCKLQFITKWKLRDHLRKKCAEKEFKCAECPEEFFLKYDLKRHARKVHCRSVDIVDSDNEGNQRSLVDGTTETDPTEDDAGSNWNDQSLEGQDATIDGNDVVNVLDDDEFGQSECGWTSNASPASNMQVDTSIFKTETVQHEQDVIYLDEDSAILSNFSNDSKYQEIDESSTNLLHITRANNGSNKTSCATNIPMSNGDMVENVSDIFGHPRFTRISSPLHTNSAAAKEAKHFEDGHGMSGKHFVQVANEPVIEFIQFGDDVSHTFFQQPARADNLTQPSSILPDMECIDLDSSNSSESKGYFFGDGMNSETEEYHTVTEEKIEITKEKIETVTSFYNNGRFT